MSSPAYTVTQNTLTTQTRHAKRAEAQAHQHALSMAAQNRMNEQRGATVCQDIVVSDNGGSGGADVDLGDDDDQMPNLNMQTG